MNSIEKTLKYYELLMTYEDTSSVLSYPLKTPFSFVFYQENDEMDWITIHIESGEFTSVFEGKKIFHQFYDSFLEELNKRCIFIQNEQGEKIATATVSKLKNKEGEYDAVIDWLAIKKGYQNQGLSKPLISRILTLAYALGHKKILLHTQTHTWLAAKIYLDYGFEPYNMEKSYFGWCILKTLTNHKKLKSLPMLVKEEMYDDDFVEIYNLLKKMYSGNFNYEIWNTNGRNDVYVYDFASGITHKYNYYKKDGIQLEKVKNDWEE